MSNSSSSSMDPVRAHKIVKAANLFSIGVTTLFAVTTAFVFLLQRDLLAAQTDFAETSVKAAEITVDKKEERIQKLKDELNKERNASQEYYRRLQSNRRFLLKQMIENKKRGVDTPFAISGKYPRKCLTTQK